MRLIWIVIVMGLAGCAGNRMIPDWQINAHGALKSSIMAYLVGNSKLEKFPAPVALT